MSDPTPPTEAPAYTKYQLEDFAEEVDISHPLTARRIPVLKHHHPRWNYHTAIIIGHPEWGGAQFAGLEPTDREVEQLCVHLEKQLRWYGPGYRQQLAAKAPFDLDGTINTYTFRKHAEYGWQYNARSWEYGPPFVPTSHPDAEVRAPLTLEQLLDHIDAGTGGSMGKRWAEVKVEFAHVFDNVPTLAT